MYIDNNSNSKYYNDHIQENIKYQFNYIKLIMIYLILTYIIILWLYYRLFLIFY